MNYEKAIEAAEDAVGYFLSCCCCGLIGRPKKDSEHIKYDPLIKEDCFSDDEQPEQKYASKPNHQRRRY